MLHTCSPGCTHDPGLRRQRSPELTIDFHCHVLAPAVETLVASEPQKLGERANQTRLLGEDAARHNEKFMIPAATRRMLSIDERLADMDRMGVDIQVLSPSPTQYYYWASEELAEVVCRTQNENIATLCDAHPQQLRGLGTVALQHPELAVKQLRHLVKDLGLQGVEISSNVNGMDLSAPLLDSFWAEASRLECVVFLHPLGTSLGERLNTHYFSNIIGQPLETTIALSQLIFDGVFDRHERLRVIAAHGGGFLPSYIGRADHGSHVRPEAGGMKKSPSDYLRQIWFDTVVYDPRVLRHLIDTVGVSQLVVGTDYPFDMGSYNVHELVRSIPDITDDECAQILGLNAAELLGLRSVVSALPR